jgi:hypothetical protein
MSKKVGIEFNQQELNDLYYCVETINRRDFSPDMSERLNLLGNLIGIEIYRLAKEQQLEDDKLRHEMNFKRAFARYGDY